VVNPPQRSFSDVLNSRRSARVMRTAPLREVVNCIAYASLSRQSRDGRGGVEFLRPSPSSAALHPVDIFLIGWQAAARVWRYDASNHRRQSLLLAAPDQIKTLARRAHDILPEAQGIGLALIGDQFRLDARYSDAESLLWRDAGALLQTLFLS